MTRKIRVQKGNAGISKMNWKKLYDQQAQGRTIGHSELSNTCKADAPRFYEHNPSNSCSIERFLRLEPNSGLAIFITFSFSFSVGQMIIYSGIRTITQDWITWLLTLIKYGDRIVYSRTGWFTNSHLLVRINYIRVSQIKSIFEKTWPLKEKFTPV